MKQARKKTSLVGGLVVVGLLFLAGPVLGQTTCAETTTTFNENFDTATYKNASLSSVSNWPAGPITLNPLGANFDIVQPSGMGAHIYVCDAGDFDGDGRLDLMGLDIREGNNYRLMLVRNHYEDADGDGLDDDGVVFYIDPAEVYDDSLTCGPAAITVADYNGDGLLDFFFMKNETDQFGFTNYVAAMYINCGTATDPDFNRYTLAPNLNFTALFKSKLIYLNWTANHLCSVDIDADGDMDIAVITREQIFVLTNPGSRNFTLNRFSLTELRYNRRTGYRDTVRGGSVIAAGDFNGDGYVDLVAGSVMNYNYLAVYLNDKKGFFTRWDLVIPRPECVGPAGLAVSDFNLDGRPDIFGGTDRWNAGYEARIWVFFNRGVPPPPASGINFEFRCLNSCDPILPDPHDVDMCVPVDYDGDGDRDIVLADANHSGDYYLIKNNVASVYATHGEAVSTNVAGGLDPVRYAITQVEILSLQQGVFGSSEGLTVDLYFSSNGGVDWEHYVTYSGAEITDYSNLPPYKFVHFGVELMWKAVFNAPVDPMLEYDNASYDTPYIGALELKYTYVERREYSRTSVMATVTDELNRKVKLIIGASFYFPGWQGQLRAYDLTSMTQMTTTTSTLRTITRSDLTSPTGREIVAENVTIYWDAGKLLESRLASERAIYTAYKPSGVLLSRLDFTTANVTTLQPILQDFNNDPAGLIDYVRGEGRGWKLGDMNHSSPQVVGPPLGDETRMGPGYAEFKTLWQSRPQCLYVGANDGMIHCFDVKTGAERWGFIPYNLLPKLRNMWPVDQATGERTSGHDVYVDGTPSIADVYIDSDRDGASEWTTILVCGQGPGQGSILGGGLNYYFALDITDPDNPQPLWEFTKPSMGETWSRPEIAKVKKGGVDTWVAFMGSGYDNDPNATVGNSFYAITLDNATLFYSWTAADVDTSNIWSSKTNIYNSLPGSPTAVDINQDGFAEVVYVGDLDGWIRRINVAPDFITSTSWTIRNFYKDANNYPIITKPAVWVNAVSGSPLPRVFFGTGGDDQAPADGMYSFVCLRDLGATTEPDWFIGDANQLKLSATYDRGDFVPGEKVWADAQIANNMVFFSTLTGNIESVDPCLDIAGEGKLYARFVEAIGAGLSGMTALRSESGALQYLALEIKARSAVTLGATEEVGGMRKREIYIHEFDSTIQKLEQPVGANLKVRSWREVYRIQR